MARKEIVCHIKLALLSSSSFHHLLYFKVTLQCLFTHVYLKHTYVKTVSNLVSSANYKFIFQLWPLYSSCCVGILRASPEQIKLSMKMADNLLSNEMAVFVMAVFL